MKRKLSSLLAVIFILLVVAVGSSWAEKLTLMLDWFPNVDHVPIYVAQQEGYFAEKGLEVKIMSPSETTDALKLAASDNVDLAVSYQPQAVIGLARGLKINVVGRLVENPLGVLLFLKDKGFKVPTDLNGKKIGYTVPGTEEVLIGAFAKLNGVKDISLVNVGFAIVPSLTSGKVDAIMGPYKNYETIALEDAGYPSDFFQLQDWGVPTYDELIFITGPKALEKKEAAVKNFVDAIEHGIAFARANPEKALEDFFKAVPDAEKSMETRAFKLTLPHFAKSQKHDPARWQTFADFAHENGLIDKAIVTRPNLKSWK
ncbi:MAG: ABC transporter substrate-binding protein [Deltaproteobacteria bacterium]|nr:ABC transporter substrate-binding protein [Deltaproteobacteria bacterium]